MAGPRGADGALIDEPPSPTPPLEPLRSSGRRADGPTSWTTLGGCDRDAGGHRPLPLDEATARELAALVDRAAGAEAGAMKAR